MTSLSKRLAHLIRTKLHAWQSDEAIRFETDHPPTEATEKEEFWLQILELEKGASHDEIRAAYLRLCKRYHPDRFATTKDKEVLANELMQELVRAYEGLMSRAEC